MKGTLQAKESEIFKIEEAKASGGFRGGFEFELKALLNVSALLRIFKDKEKRAAARNAAKELKDAINYLQLIDLKYAPGQPANKPYYYTLPASTIYDNPHV